MPDKTTRVPPHDRRPRCYGRVAGHTNHRVAVSRLDEDEKGVISIDTPGGRQEHCYVTEAGFYSLVLSFRLRKEHPKCPQLKRFRRWVTHDVLPTLRKTGVYSLAGKDPLLAKAEAVVEVALPANCDVYGNGLNCTEIGSVRFRRLQSGSAPRTLVGIRSTDPSHARTCALGGVLLTWIPAGRFNQPEARP